MKSLAMNWDESFLNDNLYRSPQFSRYLKKLLVHKQSNKERKGQINIANLVNNIRLFKKYFKIWHEFINNYKYKNRSCRKVNMNLFANQTYDNIIINYNNNYHIRKELLTTKIRSYFIYWKKHTTLHVTYKYLSSLHNNRILTSSFGIWLMSYDQSVRIHSIGMRLYKQTKRRILSYYFNIWLSEKRSITQYMRKQYERVIYRWQAYIQRVYMLRNYHKSKLKTYYKVYKHKQYNKVFTLLRSIYVTNQCILYTQDIYNNNILKSGFKRLRFMTLYNGNSSDTYQQQSTQCAIIHYNKYKIKKYMYIWHKYITDKHMNKWLYDRYFLVLKGSKYLGFWSNRTAILHTSHAKETLGVKYFKMVSVRRCFKTLRERLNTDNSNNNSTRRRQGGRIGGKQSSHLSLSIQGHCNSSNTQTMHNSNSTSSSTTLRYSPLLHPTAGPEPIASHRRRDKDTTNDDVMKLLNEMNSFLKSSVSAPISGAKQQTHALSSSSPSPRQSGTTPAVAANSSTLPTRRELFTKATTEPVSHQLPQSLSTPTSTRTAAAATHTTATTADVSAAPSSATHTRPTAPHQGTVVASSGVYRDTATTNRSSSGNSPTLSHIDCLMLYCLICSSTYLLLL